MQGCPNKTIHDAMSYNNDDCDNGSDVDDNDKTIIFSYKMKGIMMMNDDDDHDGNHADSDNGDED